MTMRSFDQEDELGDAINQLLEAPDDAATLCALFDIRLEEVETLREHVTEHSAAAFRELLIAAELRASGAAQRGARATTLLSPSMQADNVAPPAPPRFSTDELEAISRLDATATAAIGSGVLDRTRNDEIVPFSARKLVRSLISLGMPMHVGMRVAAEVPSQLGRLLTHKALLDTADVRLAVLAAIEELAGQEDSRKQFGDLLTLYAERYGSPAHPIRVVDGKRHTILTYRLVADRVIGDAVGLHLSGQWDCFGVHALLRRADVDAMSAHLVDQLRRLQISELRYTTLVELAWDTGISKKQPWFVRQPEHNDASLQAADRSHSLLQVIESLNEPLPASKYRALAFDALREASAAVLYRVGAAVGPAPRTPVTSVAHLLCTVGEFPTIHQQSFEGPKRLGTLAKLRGIAGKALGTRVFWARKWAEGRKSDENEKSVFVSAVRELLQLAER